MPSPCMFSVIMVVCFFMAASKRANFFCVYFLRNSKCYKIVPEPQTKTLTLVYCSPDRIVCFSTDAFRNLYFRYENGCQVRYKNKTGPKLNQRKTLDSVKLFYKMNCTLHILKVTRCAYNFNIQVSNKMIRVKYK